MVSNPSVEKHELNDHAVEDIRSRARLAALSIEFEKSLTFWQALTIYWRSSLWVLYGLLVAFNYGMDGIIAGYQVSVPKFREDYGTPFPTDAGVIYIIPGRWLSIFSGVSQACGILGSVLAGWLADKIGRRYTNALSCVISVAGVCVQYWSKNSLAVLCAGKAINGIPCGMWLVLGPLYASEVSCLRLRGVLSAMTNTIILSGVYLFTGVMYHLGALPYRSSYMIPFACQWIVPGIVLLTVWFWPESPVWLVRVGKRDAAIKSLDMLHGQHSGIDKQGLLAQIEETLELERAANSGSTKDSNSYMEAFSKLIDAERSSSCLCMVASTYPEILSSLATKYISINLSATQHKPLFSSACFTQVSCLLPTLSLGVSSPRFGEGP
jgi:SP family general alpha glucoside:H+ symporter-like MFS transporter